MLSLDYHAHTIATKNIFILQHTYTTHYMYIYTHTITHRQQVQSKEIRTVKCLSTKKKTFKFIFKIGAVGRDRISNSIEFHNSGDVTKNECLNALMVEDSRFDVKECA